MMEHRTRAGNRLLAALPPADFRLLAPYLQKVPLKQDAMLLRSGDRIEQVYFPLSGAFLGSVGVRLGMKETAT